MTVAQTYFSAIWLSHGQQQIFQRKVHQKPNVGQEHDNPILWHSNPYLQQ